MGVPRVHGYVLQMTLDYNGGNEYPKHPPKAVKDASKKKRQRAPSVGPKMRAKWPTLAVCGAGTRAVGWPSGEGLGTLNELSRSTPSAVE